ncbi:MAG: hypothetical protein P4L92_02940 [Rudaea sp.]|nr:hypothetical protein [Rudaea sp.]
MVGAEDFTQSAFFMAQFAPQRDEDNEQRQKSASSCPHNRRGEIAQDDQPIDGPPRPQTGNKIIVYSFRESIFRLCRRQPGIDDNTPMPA